MTSTKPVKIEETEQSQSVNPSETELLLGETNSSHLSANRKSWSFWTVFSSTFLTIFLAEMGDKTQLATLLMSAESQSPWIVFAGSATALIATSLLGVLVGYWIARRLSPKTLDLAVAVLLLLITGLLLGDVIQ